jgi:hypothetical protein
LHFAQDFLRRRHSGVRADQELFEFLPELVIDLRPIEEPRDVAEPALPRTLKRLLGLLVRFLGALEDA